MVLETDILIRMVIAEYLRNCGYKVLEGSSAEDAMTVLNAGQEVDAVFSEVRLGGSLGGFALAQWVRERHSAVSIILTSGVTKATETAAALCEQGPNDITIEKPYEAQAVARHISLLLDRRRANGERSRAPPQS